MTQIFLDHAPAVQPTEMDLEKSALSRYLRLMALVTEDPLPD